LKLIEEAKEKCISTQKPDENCHRKSQEALEYTKGLYNKILEEYRRKLPNRPPPPRT
jgi:hypothetical protein